VTTGTRAAALAIGWFPREEWARAIERWPDLTEQMPVDHRAYCEAIEARTKRLARSIGHHWAMTPLTVDALEDVAERDGGDAGAADTRSHLAARQLEQGLGTPWPPRRNEPCWCRSGRKYKQCCGPVPAVPDTEEVAEGQGAEPGDGD
jgi:hypothetical protein